MKLALHHVNLCTKNVPEMDKFYKDILDFQPEPGLDEVRNNNASETYNGAVSFITEGNIQFHLAETDHGVAFRAGHSINPLERGHIAFRTDDIEAFKKRLEDNNVPYANYDGWAMNGWHQIFFYDPDGNIIEVHQVDE